MADDDLEIPEADEAWFARARLVPPSTLRRGLPPLPRGLKMRPVDRARGLPAPWFLADQDGSESYDFRKVAARRVAIARRNRLCWVCGQSFVRDAAVIGGIASMINSIVVDPPSHVECAEFAVKVCPFMVYPEKRRGPEAENNVTPGEMLPHNPGLAFVFIAGYPHFIDSSDGRGGRLIRMPPVPLQLTAWARGRWAQPDELAAGIRLGMSKLMDIAFSEGTGSLLDLGARTVHTFAVLRDHLPAETQKGISYADLIHDLATKTAVAQQRERTLRNIDHFVRMTSNRSK